VCGGLTCVKTQACDTKLCELKPMLATARGGYRLMRQFGLRPEGLTFKSLYKTLFMKTFNLSLYIVIFGCLALFLSIGCTKENLEDDRPDFIFQGTLTDITDGTPKEGWTVYLREFISLYDPRPTGWFAPTSFGFDTISRDGRFSMEVNTFTDFEMEGNVSGENTPEARQAYYTRHVLSFRAPGVAHGFNFDRPDHLFLDPDDGDLQLDEFDFSRRGEVITRDVKIFTGYSGKVRYRYLIERSPELAEFITAKTTLRDLAFARAFLSVSPVVTGSIEPGEQYERNIYLPVGRQVEAVTSFRTTSFQNHPNLEEVDSIIIRDTFLLQSAADTLQLRDYSY
jgi:hypothetical protein